MTGAMGMVTPPNKFRAPVSEVKIYARRLFFWDVVVVSGILAAVSAVFFIGLPLLFEAEYSGNLRIQIQPVALALTLWVLYVFFLVLFKTWNVNVAGTGIPEYLMLSKVSLATLGVLAFAALAFKLDVSRLFVFTAILSTTLGLIGHRWTGRQWLLAQRRKRSFMHNTALIGPANQIAELVPRLNKSLEAGYRPYLAALFGADYTPKNIKLLSDLGLNVIRYDGASLGDADTVDLQVAMVLGAEEMDANRIKHLAWALEGTNIELVIAPALVDFAGQRIVPTSVAGMQFLKIETPTFSGAKYFFKSIFDLALGGLLTLIALPVMLVTSIAIFIEDRGSVLFFQERIGRNGKPFKMVKFRSMFMGAEKLHEEMLRTSNKSPNSILYKNPEDPRVTKVGKFIRKWSIDELPQLFNVLAGQMSLVGPRPPLSSEVSQYEIDMMRRLLVKPGITGLWQTSGRADLSFEESMQVDLSYVENWSLFGDLLIVLKTVKAVFGRRGSY